MGLAEVEQFMHHPLLRAAPSSQNASRVGEQMEYMLDTRGSCRQESERKARRELVDALCNKLP